LQAGTREIDYVARYGGEEFLVVLPDTDVEGAVRVAERIRGKLAKRTVVAGKRSVKLTVSIGAAEFPNDGESTEALIVSADDALYKAKRRGRDRVVRAGSRRSTTVAKPPKKVTRKTSAKRTTTSRPNSKKKAATKRTRKTTRAKKVVVA